MMFLAIQCLTRLDHPPDETTLPLYELQLLAVHQCSARNGRGIRRTNAVVVLAQAAAGWVRY